MHAQPFFDAGLKYTPHFFTLPLDYQQPEAAKITVFAREVARANDAHLAKNDISKPWLIYFQGGPGFPSPRPDGTGWIGEALRHFRVLLLDQRGTGHSSVISHQTLASLSPDQQAHYLSHFRADNIVRDAEAIRDLWGIKQWATLGQSFGGFCTLTYLSMFPDSLSQCLITGGVPSISRHPDDVYHATFERTRDKNRAFFRQFPDAQALCQNIADHLLSHETYLPNGQRFTVEQFQQLGIRFGASGTFLPTYYLLENALIDINGQRQLRYEFLQHMLVEQSCQTNPIYALLHEAIYCQGFASNWSAQRVREQINDFDYQPGKPFLFTGEMVFPWMFDQYQTLKPLKEAAAQLACKDDWPALYDAKQLQANTVPVACAVYADDMFVELDFSRETLKAIPNARAWITNEYEHNGLRADGERILQRLMAINADTAATLS